MSTRTSVKNPSRMGQWATIVATALLVTGSVAALAAPLRRIRAVPRIRKVVVTRRAFPVAPLRSVAPVPSVPRPVVTRRLAVAPTAKVQRDRKAMSARARALLALYLRRGLRQQYVATETTRLLRGRVRISQQVVKHVGPGRIRIEYLLPPALHGDVLLIAGGRVMKYSARAKRIQVGPVTDEDFASGEEELLRSVRSGALTVDVVGNEIVAGQNAAIVEVRAAGGSFYKRLWIDEKTGVRLRIEDTDPQGNPVSTSQYTSISYDAAIAPSDFSLSSLPAASKEPLLPASAPLASLDQARRMVAYTVQEPSLPAGFRLTGVWVTGARTPRATTILRYANGVSTITLYEQAQTSRRITSPAPPTVPPRWRGGFLFWATDDHRYYMVGNIRTDTAQHIIDSLGK